MPESGTHEARITLVEGRAGFVQTARELAVMARTELVIFSYELDHRIYGDELFVESVKRFLLGGDRARVRGLVNAAQTAMRSSNRLIELAKRLSSKIEFRQLPEDCREMRDEYLACNARHYIHRRDPRDLEAKYYAEAPLQTRELLKGFEEIWQASPPAREFTDLKL